MNKESFKRNGVRWAIVFGVFIVASTLVLLQAIPSPKIVTNEQGFSYIAWDGTNIVSATENSTIGSVASGFLEIYFVNHTASPTTAYDDNVSKNYETWANASTDPDGTGTTYKAYSTIAGFSLTVKWGVAMDMLIRYRGNVTHAKNATIFNAANCRVKVNASGGGCTTLSSQVLTQVVSKNGTGCTFIWINAYYSIGTLNKGGTYTITNIKIEFNY
jgi:hypothetical protein